MLVPAKSCHDNTVFTFSKLCSPVVWPTHCLGVCFGNDTDPGNNFNAWFKHGFRKESKYLASKNWLRAGVGGSKCCHLAQVFVPCFPVLHIRSSEPGPTLHLEIYGHDIIIDRLSMIVVSWCLHLQNSGSPFFSQTFLALSLASS